MITTCNLWYHVRGRLRDERIDRDAERGDQTAKAIYEANEQVRNLWNEHDAILENSLMTDAEREAAARDVRRQINELLLQANTVMGDYWAKYGYASENQQNVRNFLTLFTDGKATPMVFQSHFLL